MKETAFFQTGNSDRAGVLNYAARSSWLSVLLDGAVPPSLVFALLDSSHRATAPDWCRADPRDREIWILPSNPHYFDLEAAFAQNSTLRWQQRIKAAVGDIVYLYVMAPVCAVLYRCQVVRTDIPWHYDDGRIRTECGMDLQLQQHYTPDFLPREKLQAYGIRAVRGPGICPTGWPACWRKNIRRCDPGSFRPGLF